ncbi:MAG: 50S ribosomal protein L23 [Candidatus Nitrosotenuis sp.]|uniref:Large ribosomal subunit protein uL23 n=1 Tax=Candidatus Nitrosotenuis uzonensis TaxID=1407055 RepID=V6ASD4_9ARCH|nr:50S ribosomal protein L23 [Candidatus Nitrosotenuis uzonensis]CDI05557.1 50S ribosomal protein L23P [Candidatus Nitrosotenuis uzonensis]
MNTAQATKIIIRPYITEKTFALIEKDARICFIVDTESNKNMIKEAIKTLYEEDAIDINTARTISGKKAFVKFETVEKARDLATKIGML